VALRGSILYFVIADLANMDPMYQYSLDFFTKLFVNRLERSTKSEDQNRRLTILIEDVTRAFYFSICRGLFEKDKLLYSFLNATSILRRTKKINIDEWNFFLRGSPTDFTKFENRIDFISDDVFNSLLGLEESHPNFKDIVKSFEDPSKSLYTLTVNFS
jgi:dynein heavy chain